MFLNHFWRNWKKLDLLTGARFCFPKMEIYGTWIIDRMSTSRMKVETEKRLDCPSKLFALRKTRVEDELQVLYNQFGSTATDCWLITCCQVVFFLNGISKCPLIIVTRHRLKAVFLITQNNVLYQVRFYSIRFFANTTTEDTSHSPGPPQLDTSIIFNIINFWFCHWFIRCVLIIWTI